MGGVCACADTGLAHLLTKADEAMYRVKATGRNGVHLQLEPGPLRLVEGGEG